MSARLPAAERRQQIAEAALRVLAAKGAHRLTAAEIAAAVGVTDGSLFKHFRSMEDIVDAAIATFEALLEGDMEAGGEPLERLRVFFVRRLAKVRARPEIMRLAFSDRLEEVAGPGQAERVRAGVGRSVAFVRARLREAQRQGQVVGGVPVDVLVWMVTGALRGAALSARGRGAGSPDEVWQDVARVLTRRRAPPKKTAGGDDVPR